MQEITTITIPIILVHWTAANPNFNGPSRSFATDSDTLPDLASENIGSKDYL
jgi:hypothetical protein